MSHIFFLQATIFRLHIGERIIYDAEGDTDLTVKIDLLDIPSLVIHRDESFRDIGLCDGNCGQNLDYYSGRACHFVAKWPEIVNAIKKKPLKIGIFRIDERFPLCYGVVPFSGCVCDLVEKAMEELSPLELRGNYRLIDPGENPAGHISLEIVLLDLGKNVTALFALARESFVLKKDREAVEYACGEEKHERDCDTGFYGLETIDDCCWIDNKRENFMPATIGICLAANRLSRGRTEAKKVQRSLTNDETQNDKSDRVALSDKRSTEKSAKKTGKKTKKRTK